MADIINQSADKLEEQEFNEERTNKVLGLYKNFLKRNYENFLRIH